MKTMWFRITQNGAYSPCPKPLKDDDLIIEVTDIPNDKLHADVLVKLNQTAIYGFNSVSYDQLRQGNNVKSRGGAREGAGRPATGRRKCHFYVTEDEEKRLREYLKMLRESPGIVDNKGSMIEVTLCDGRVGQLVDIQIKNELGEPPQFLLCFEGDEMEMDWFDAKDLADRY